MKNMRSFFKVCTGLLLLTGCEAEIPVTGDPNPNLSIYDLRNIHKESSVVLSKDNMKEAVSVTGVVISDTEQGNAPAGKIVLQGYKGKNISGIVLDVGISASNYQFGDSIVAVVEGLTLSRVGGVLEIEDVPVSAITKIASGKTPLISATYSSISNLLTDASKYESTLVALNSMFVVDPQVGKKYGDNLKLTDWASEIDIPVNASAKFANQEVYNLANYVFLLNNNTKGEPQLLLQNLNKVNELEMEPYTGGLYKGFPEDFTDKLGSSTSLNHDVIMSTSKLPWIIKGAYILNSGNFVFTNGYLSSSNKGDQIGVMMTGSEGSYIELNKNLYYGCSKIDLNLYPATSTDAGTGKLPLVVRIDYSKDSGASWTQIGDLINITENKKYPAVPISVDIEGIVRFRITLVKKGANNDGGRLGIDYVRIYQN